jgi:hypothetical protein
LFKEEKTYYQEAEQARKRLQKFKDDEADGADIRNAVSIHFDFGSRSGTWKHWRGRLGLSILNEDGCKLIRIGAGSEGFGANDSTDKEVSR